jgi:quercetin dioxygenase-like cupin family protein
VAGRYFNSSSMTFAHYEFDAGSPIHGHSHPQEEVWQIIEGELEITIGGVTKHAGPGFVGIVSPEAHHAVRALTNGKPSSLTTRYRGAAEPPVSARPSRPY